MQTAGGIVGRLRAAGRDQLRPLTGLASATPIIGDDGRIYFLSGRVNGFAGATETLVFAASASVWSVTATGEDLRREPVTLDTDSFRLDGMWPNGFLLHRGTNPAQIAVVKSILDLPTSAGLLERVQVSPDRKVAIGFAGTNLVRLDLTPNGVVASAVVLLGSVQQGDSWFPRTAALATNTPSKADVPAARYVFALGGNLWTMGADGSPTLLRAGNTNAQTLRRNSSLPPPLWSPAGDKMLTVESLSTGASAFQLIAVVISRDGTVRRYVTPSSIGALPTWSPQGNQFTVVGLPAATGDPVVLTSDLTISILDAASGAPVTTIPGREAIWTQSGIVLINNGTFRVADRARENQAIEIWNAGEKRQIVTVAKLIADPRTQAPAPAASRGNTETLALTAASDGAHLSVHINFLGTTTVPSFAVIRAKDGTPSAVIAGDRVSDEAWSSTSRHIGYTLSAPQLGSSRGARTIVRDAETGDVVIDQDGRFAGWSPDGLWVYSARNEGLFARRVGGGDAVRFSPYGVVVSATKP